MPIYGGNRRPEVVLIAHRGASAYRPEHTLEAYQLAIDLGCDYIEPDLVSTRDGVLIARHENNITETTNVADIAEFASRKATKIIDGETITGWFTEDFTLSEIKSMRCKERIPEMRPGNTQYDGQFQMATFAEIIELAKRNTIEKGKIIGVYPETKHPSYFRSIGLPLEDRLLAQLSLSGWNHSLAPVFIQSFEVSNLQMLRSKTNIKLIQLVDDGDSKPFDFVAHSDSRKYADIITMQGLKHVASYCDGIGAPKSLIRGQDGIPSDLVKNCHDVGLMVHVWTFRPENNYLPPHLQTGGGPGEYGDAVKEIQEFLELGVDGIFCDASDYGRKAIAQTSL
jgi:glycerophosphoryl diester phosphodiesterase